MALFIFILFFFNFFNYTRCCLIKLLKRIYIFLNFLRFSDQESTAIRCKLHNLVPISGEWSEEAFDLLNHIKDQSEGIN